MTRYETDSWLERVGIREAVRPITSAYPLKPVSQHPVAEAALTFILAKKFTEADISLASLRWPPLKKWNDALLAELGNGLPHDGLPEMAWLHVEWAVWAVSNSNNLFYYMGARSLRRMMNTGRTESVTLYSTGTQENYRSYPIADANGEFVDDFRKIWGQRNYRILEMFKARIYDPALVEKALRNDIDAQLIAGLQA